MEITFLGIELSGTAKISKEALKIGETVEAGQPAGQVHCVHNPEREPWALTTKRSETLICKRPVAKVSRDDCVGVFAQDIEGL